MLANARCPVDIALPGRYFQILDDDQHPVSKEHIASKGLCEDLNEGKFTYVLIHALHHSGARMLQTKAILQEWSPDASIRAWSGT